MKTLVCLIALTAIGCAHPSGDLYHSRGYQERPTISASLVKDDTAMLSEGAIGTLLASRIRIPEKVKLAVLPLGHSGRVGYSEFPQERKACLAALERPLSETGRFTEITHVPSMMVPDQPSLTRLREAAALMQAELLLVYSTRSHIVTWQSLWVKDEARAMATIELILMDVRTGVVPYAETFEDQHLEKESSDDLSVAELQRRAERIATERVMARAAEGLKGFMAR